jgi:hypothetical protein
VTIEVLLPAPGAVKPSAAVPGALKKRREQEAVMTSDVKRNGDARKPKLADELPPELKGRIKGLVYDLSNDDLPMALLDLAHLYRALQVRNPRCGKLGEPLELTEDLRTLIFSEDRAALDEICMGPDEQGRCPRAAEGHPVDCADKWIMNKGWNFKVAPDAETCPLISLGLAHRYLRATVAGKK